MGHSWSVTGTDIHHRLWQVCYLATVHVPVFSDVDVNSHADHNKTRTAVLNVSLLKDKTSTSTHRVTSLFEVISPWLQLTLRCLGLVTVHYLLPLTYKACYDFFFFFFLDSVVLQAAFICSSHYLQLWSSDSVLKWGRKLDIQKGFVKIFISNFQLDSSRVISWALPNLAHFSTLVSSIFDYFNSSPQIICQYFKKSIKNL